MKNDVAEANKNTGGSAEGWLSAGHRVWHPPEPEGQVHLWLRGLRLQQVTPCGSQVAEAGILAGMMVAQ